MQADEHLKDQGFFGRIMNRIGLHTANAVDRMTSVVHNAPAAFLGGSAFGALRGGTIGLAAWALAYAFILPAAAGPLAFAAIVGTSAAVFGMIHGQRAVDHYAVHAREKSIGDRIAERTGAVEESRLVNPITENNPEEQAKVNHAALVQSRRETAQRLAKVHPTPYNYR